MVTANLLSRLQRLTAPDREVDALIAAHFKLKLITGTWPDWCIDPPFTESLDAAVALCERVLPGKWPDILREALRLMGREYDWHISIDRQPPELLCKFVLIAILTALEARDGTE